MDNTYCPHCDKTWKNDTEHQLTRCPECDMMTDRVPDAYLETWRERCLKAYRSDIPSVGE
jgi:uncharacterized C2H2 Zn-finger protein